MARSFGNLAMQRRAILSAAAFGVGEMLWPSRAEATLVRGLSLPALAEASEFILVATPLSASSHWQDLGGRRRIVTDTQVRVEDVLAKTVPSDGELLVRTLGGTVGDRAALVYGEAALWINETSVLFMVRDAGVQRVLGMAQGHYPIHADADQTLRLTRSPRAPELTGDAEPAMRILPGQELSRARTLIQLALGR
jgi:hypothetical protein